MHKTVLSPVPGKKYRDQEKVFSAAMVRPGLIDYVLRDAGVLDAEVDARVQKAVKKYIVKHCRAFKKYGNLEEKVGDLRLLVMYYQDGFEDGLVHAGLLKQRSSP